MTTPAQDGSVPILDILALVLYSERKWNHIVHFDLLSLTTTRKDLYPSIKLTTYFVASLTAVRKSTRTLPCSPILLRVTPKTKDQIIRPSRLTPSTNCPTSRTSVRFCNKTRTSLGLMVRGKPYTGTTITAKCKLHKIVSIVTMEKYLLFPG